MDLPILLILLPVICGLVIAGIKNFDIRKNVVFGASLLIVLLSVLCVINSTGALPVKISYDAKWVNTAMFMAEMGMAALIGYMAIKYRSRLAMALTAAQIVMSVFFEMKYGHSVSVQNDIVIDQLTIIMLLIIGIVGGLIGVFATGYMKTWQAENPEIPDRRRYFFFLIFAFMGAMFGLVLSNNILWMYFFWEVTTVCSFLLIGYTKTPEAIRNSFKAINMNMLGGLFYLLAIILLAAGPGVLEFDRLGTVERTALLIPVTFLCIAGFTKTAMLPFSHWLLGAMVAPTPVSALLHSSTMVKAGVYLFIRISPLCAFTLPGYLTAFVGGITFLIGAFLAISQRNSKRVLAYSTISNLGLIVACAGLGTYQTIWVALFLTIFHAVAKSLMFLTVGSAAAGLGTLDIEGMRGLIIKMPKVAIMMLAGICGMFLAPFGMLISKWAAMEAIISLGLVLSSVMIIIIAYGSAATIFFWTKWLGIIIRERNPHAESGLYEHHVSGMELVSEGILTVLTLCTCVAFPLVSKYAVEPYLMATYGKTFGIDQSNTIIMVIMMIMMIVIPVVLIASPRLKKKPLGTAYMGGRSSTEALFFEGTAGIEKQVQVQNYYMGKIFNEKKLLPAGMVLCVIILMVMVGSVLR